MDINLTEPQTRIFTSPARFRVACCGRRFGKSYLAIAECLRAAFAKPKQTVWFVAPSYSQAKLIAWNVLKDLSAPVLVKKHETELWVEFANGSRITLKGASDEDSLRGASISFLILDEYASMNPKVWSWVLRPACADQRARVLFIGSPAGKNTFYDLWLQGQDDEFEDWASWQYTTLEGGNVHPEEIEAARLQMDDRTFRQEFLANFQDNSGKIVYNFDRRLSVRDIEDRQSVLRVGIDFNVNPITATIGQMSAQNELEIFDEIYMSNSNTFELADEINIRYPNRTIIAYPDPAGRQRKTSAGGKTDFTILEDAGFKVVAPRKHDAQKDGINNLNSAFLNAKDERRMWVSPKCKRLIECLDRWCYKEGTSIPDKDSGFDHMVDSLKYMVNQLMPIVDNKLSTASVRMW